MTQTKQGTQPKAQQRPGTELALLKKQITDQVMQRITPMIESKEIRLPANFSAGNALQSAWLELLEMESKPLEKCTHLSIANALYKMCIWGLSVSKKQVAFIPYGTNLKCNPEYHGNIALAKRYGNVKDVFAGVIYKDDVFKYAVDEAGRKRIVSHDQEVQNIKDDEIMGAYAVLTFNDDRIPYLEVMSMDQIRKSWNQGATHGTSPAHKNFPGEMAKKTVISRACKFFWTTSDDSALMENEDDDLNVSGHVEGRNGQVAEKGNRKAIETEDVPYEEISHKEPETHEKTDEPTQPLSNLGSEPEKVTAPNY